MEDSGVQKCKPFTGKPIKIFLIFFVFEFSRVSPDDQPLAKEPKNSGYEIGTEKVLGSASNPFTRSNT